MSGPDVVTLLRGLYLWNHKPSGLLWWVTPSLLPCMGTMPNHVDVSTHWGTWRVLPEGMSHMFPVLFLGNGWADLVEIWYALGDSLVTAYAAVTGELYLHVRTCRDPHTAFMYLGKGLANCVQIWYVGSGLGSLTTCFSQVMASGMHLLVCTCPPIFHKCSACYYPVTVAPIALKFGMHLETH